MGQMGFYLSKNGFRAVLRSFAFLCSVVSRCAFPPIFLHFLARGVTKRDVPPRILPSRGRVPHGCGGLRAVVQEGPGWERNKDTFFSSKECNLRFMDFPSILFSSSYGRITKRSFNSQLRVAF